MRKARGLILSLFVAGAALAATPAMSEEKLNLYNWTVYINPDILTDFSKETGIKVNLDGYATNEEMLAKIQAGATGYDIVFPSVHMQDIMTNLNLLQPAGLKDLKGYDNLDQKYFLAKTDPDHTICLPYNRGTSGLMYNKKLVGGTPVDTWKVVFDPPAELRGKIAMLDDVRETIGAALMYNGFSINSTDPKELAKARDTIRKAKPYWAAMLTEGIGDKVINGDFVVAQWWSGTVVQTMDTKPEDIGYAIPKEGTNGFQEDMCLLASAPNIESAKRFFEYMMRPEVNAKNTNWLRGWSTNKAALPLIDPKLTSNTSIYPNEEIFKRLQLIQDVGDKIRLYDKVWTDVKAR